VFVEVSELYELARKWEPVSDSLPHITERLAALQQLHEQGTSCTRLHSSVLLTYTVMSCLDCCPLVWITIIIIIKKTW